MKNSSLKNCHPNKKTLVFSEKAFVVASMFLLQGFHLSFDCYYLDEFSFSSMLRCHSELYLLSSSIEMRWVLLLSFKKASHRFKLHPACFEATQKGPRNPGVAFAP